MHDLAHTFTGVDILNLLTSKEAIWKTQGVSRNITQHFFNFKIFQHTQGWL